MTDAHPISVLGDGRRAMELLFTAVRDGVVTVEAAMFCIAEENRMLKGESSQVEQPVGLLSSLDPAASKCNCPDPGDDGYPRIGCDYPHCKLDVEVMAKAIGDANQDDRAQFMKALFEKLGERFCTECWREDPRCQCWNDE